MNLALGAFIITMLFLPAVAYRIAINRQENLKELLSTVSATDSIWIFSVVPIVIHIVLLFVFKNFLKLTVKFDLILNILYSNKDFKIHNYVFTNDVMRFLGYCFIAISLGYTSGIFSNWLETKFRLFSRVLGLGNKWYELFEPKINDEEFDLVYIDVLSNTREATTLYSGILVNYYYKPKTTELEYLVLQAAARRDMRKEQISDVENISSGKLSHYSPEAGEPLKIPGEYFIIPMKEVLNINVSYINTEAESSLINSLEEQ